jgi:hypothetical protein
MGIIKKVGESIKEVVKDLSEEIKTRQNIRRTKKRILDRFEMNDLKSICRDYGIGEPSPYWVDPLTGEKSRITIRRDHYIDLVINKLSLEQIKNFCDKRRIKIWDILEEVPKPTPSITEIAKEPTTTESEIVKQATQMDIKSDLDFILESIKGFEPEPVRDEEDFEKQLFQFLKLKYPNQVERQVETREGKIDIVINGLYALELKIADSRGKLRDLIGQLYSYKKVYDNVSVVLLDIGKMSYHEIKNYVDDYRRLGVKTVILRGKFVPPKGKKEREIIIKHY